MAFRQIAPWLCALSAVVALDAAHAAPVTLNALTLDRLAASPTWRRLLHVADGQRLSDVRSPEFFLAPEGNADARAELVATLVARDAPWPGDVEQHPVCRFPARFRWLATQLNWTDTPAIDPRCTKVQAWARLKEVQSVSLYMVSGYFGNPASTFGHALLKFNTGSPDAPSSALDVSVNFGAAVPPAEPTPLYVLKGLTGGYQAGFSDKAFFTDTAMYSHTEYRDMWEYELALSQPEQELLILHLAELSGQKFDYYFLNRNCAFRLAELLTLATGDKVEGAAHGWYAPVELFQVLHKRRSTGAPWTTHAPRFVPSAERKLRHALSNLSGDELALVERLVGSEQLTGLHSALLSLPVSRRGLVADTLLAYQTYRVEAAQPSPPESVVAARAAVLRERLFMPVGSAAMPAVPDRPSPAELQPPMRLGLAAWRSRDPAERGTRLSWSPFHHGPVGSHGLEDQDLVAINLQADVLSDGRLRWADSDLLNIRKLSPDTHALPALNTLSWLLRLGWQSSEPTRHHIRPYLRAGAGKSAAWAGATWSGMLTAEAGGASGHLGLSPWFGVDSTLGSVRVSGWVSPFGGELKQGLPRWRGMLETAWPLSGDLSLRVAVEQDPQRHLVVGLQQFY